MIKSTVVVAVVLAVICILLMAGCLNFMRGPETEVESVKEWVEEDGSMVRVTEVKKASAGSYHGADAAKINFGTTKVKNGEASTGKTEQKSEEGGAPMSPLYIIGGILMAGGIIVGYITGSLMLGVVCFVAGASVIAIGRFLDVYPWAVWIPVIGAIGYGAYMLWLGKENEKTLGVVVPVIDEMENGSDIKVRIGEKAGTYANRIKDNITRIKRKLRR